MPDLVDCNIAWVDFMGAGDLDIQMLNLQLMVLDLVCTLIIQTSRYLKQKLDSHAQIYTITVRLTAEVSLESICFCNTIQGS